MIHGVNLSVLYFIRTPIFLCHNSNVCVQINSPPSPGNLNTLRQQLSAAHSMSGNIVAPHSLTGQSSPSVYFGLSRRGSLSSLTGQLSSANFICSYNRPHSFE